MGRYQVKGAPSKASILTIGTELTSGQILNRNAQWISQKLQTIEVDVTQHVTVADDKASTLSALERLEKESQLIFITGGLGPTSDDITREIIAEWLGKPLAFDDSVWINVQTRLEKLGRKVVESHRNQAQFPQGVRILPNQLGTAAGFTFLKGSCSSWVLPGPTEELQGIWDNHIQDELASKYKNPQIQLVSFLCIGRPESEIADITENCIQGLPVQSGYRLTGPFVEVKLWYSQEHREELQILIQKVENELKPWLAFQGRPHPLPLLIQRLKKYHSVEVIDGVSEGFLFEKLKEPFQKELPGVQFEFRSGINSQLLDADLKQVLKNDHIRLILAAGKSSTEASCLVQTFKDVHTKPLQAPYSDTSKKRNRQAFGELAIDFWSEKI